MIPKLVPKLVPKLIRRLIPELIPKLIAGRFVTMFIQIRHTDEFELIDGVRSRQVDFVDLVGFAVCRQRAGREWAPTPDQFIVLIRIKIESSTIFEKAQ